MVIYTWGENQLLGFVTFNIKMEDGYIIVHKPISGGENMLVPDKCEFKRRKFKLKKVTIFTFNELVTVPRHVKHRLRLTPLVEHPSQKPPCFSTS